MSAPFEVAGGFEALKGQLRAGGWRLDWLDQGPVSGDPMLAVFAHPDGRRLRYVQDLMTGRATVEVSPGGAAEPALFAGFDVETRRQVLRRWMHERQAPTATVEAVLQAAFRDPDAEVRMTAVLAALRLRAMSLAGAVASADIPDSTAGGAFPGDRLLYRRLQAVAAEALAGRNLHRAEALAAALDGPIDRPEALVLHSLITPLPVVEPPSAIPPGLVEGPGGVRLERLAIEMRRAPAIAHWRGGLRPIDRADPRPRLETPQGDIYAAQAPLSAIMLERLGVPTDEAGRVDAAGAVLAAERASQIAGERLAMMDIQTLGFAMHGPDGRMLPWGNARAPSQALGPWGFAFGLHPEWTTTSEGVTAIDVTRPVHVPAERAAVRLRLAEL